MSKGRMKHIRHVHIERAYKTRIISIFEQCVWCWKRLAWRINLPSLHFVWMDKGKDNKYYCEWDAEFFSSNLHCCCVWTEVKVAGNLWLKWRLRLDFFLLILLLYQIISISLFALCEVHEWKINWCIHS